MAQREPWTGDVVRSLHLYGLTRNDLAKEMGVSAAWVTRVLNGKGRAVRSKEQMLEALTRLTSAG